MEKDKKVIVKADLTFEEVLRYDNEGMLLVWEPEDFQPLKDEELRQLRKANRDRYEIFKEIHEDSKKRIEEDEEILGGFQVGVTSGLAARRLDVKGKDENFSYRWERPDMVEDRRDEGWQITKKGVKTLRNQEGKGIHRIGAQGQEELILMQMPKDRLSVRKERKKAMRARAIEGIANESRSNIEKLGGIPVSDRDGGNFRPISHEEVSNG